MTIKRVPTDASGTAVASLTPEPWFAARIAASLGSIAFRSNFLPR
jgi:hypothetical protein